MANPEHLAILKKGVGPWNEWRRLNPGTASDLIWADLSRTNLSEIDLSNAKLANADLSDCDLPKANLGNADLSAANLSGADLLEANLSRARLIDADLSESNLSEVKLVKADLSRARLSRANLSRAGLSGANLWEADLLDANLSGADLNNADLFGANLTLADLSKANLSGADLRFSQLCQCVFTDVILSGAKLYGSARDDWLIGNVTCKYVFWDAGGKVRSPNDRDLAPGEFERIYRALPTIEYIFENGITPLDPLIMDRVVEVIRGQNPEFDIRIDSISARGLAPSIKLTVRQEEMKQLALAEVTRVYEAKVHELAGRLDEARGFIQRLIDRPNSVYIENSTGPLAIGGSTINIDQHIEYITNLRDAVAAQAEDSPAFRKVAKKTAMDIIGGTMKDVAKGQVKEAAKQIYELGKDLGPVILNTAAYAFFRNMMQGGIGG